MNIIKYIFTSSKPEQIQKLNELFNQQLLHILNRDVNTVVLFVGGFIAHIF
jgi:hypothetical protein